MIDAGAAVLRVRRQLRRRAAGASTPVPDGLLVRCPELPDVPDLNALHLDDPAPAGLSAADLDALTDRWLRGLDHHHVVLDDAAAGERLGAALEPAGWIRRRVGVMALGPDAAAVTAHWPGEVRQLTEAELAAIQRAAMAEEAPPAVADAVLDQLAEGLSRLRTAAGLAAGFGACHAGAPVASASLLVADDPAAGTVALIEEVGTLRVSRGQGAGRAVVTAALAGARRAQADVIAVCVDADDWPQLMYAQMGFALVARQVTLSRPSPASGARRTAV